MTESQEQVINIMKSEFGTLSNIQEFIDMVGISSDDKLPAVCEALEKAWENRDYVAPVLPPIDKEKFSFSVPGTKASIKPVLKKMEKGLPTPVYNQFVRLNDGKQKHDPEQFEETMGALISKTFQQTECSWHEMYTVYETAAMQFSVPDSSTALIDLISRVYTEYKYDFDMAKYKASCVTAEVTNSILVDKAARLDAWAEVAQRVQQCEALCKVFPWIPALDLSTDEAAEALALIVCVKVDQKKHLLLDPETLQYSFEARDKDEVIIFIRKQTQYQNPLCQLTFMKEDEKTGDLIEKPVARGDLYENHLTISQYAEFDLRASDNYELSRQGKQIGVKQSGISRSHPEAVYSETCNTWLEKLTGEFYDMTCVWVAHSTDFGTALPAYSILGHPNVGKSLLMLAIKAQFKCAEAWMTPISFEEETFSGALLTLPFIVADDGGLEITAQNRESWKDKFKGYVTQSAWTINQKYGGIITMEGHIRSYCAFNQDKPHVRKLFNVMNDALGQRIFDVSVPDENVEWLESMFQCVDCYGEENPVNAWLGIDGILTKHVAWLIENKDSFPVPSKTGRWGNMRDYVFKGALASTKTEQLILEFVKNSVNDNTSYCRKVTRKEETLLFFNIRVMLEAFRMESGQRNTSEKDIKDLLTGLGAYNTGLSIDGKTVRQWRIQIEVYNDITEEEE